MADAQRLELEVDRLPLRGGAQLAGNAALAAKRKKVRANPELVGSGWPMVQCF